ncbi:LCP family protein [Clostridium chauvoei]|uniref:LCP family protein n=2 Tax=Clostridium chauvoei TaxID=46867 RepID=A0ABD4RFQ3_9CLOT|nr:LCP family protein [Clostridium chauvoei]ATD55850.1 LytR family transcriptional regulator [Clostridium chauvoei]ATD56478.1 LytR family transcriptional regulator [Clostridium chauvoei]MBX7280211.1 LCP family protein [Clostridium chauvoei]MBX7282679.1 LCP family protein [Clostridium chauvoei]MBX7285102.1 LCP family protein [Clostridium chauvoei]
MSNKRDAMQHSSPKKSLKNEQLRRKKMKIQMRKRKIKRAIMSFIILILVLFIGGGLYTYSFLAKLNNDTKLSNPVTPERNEPINILVVGMDIGDAENLGNKTARRTDSIMVVNYNPSTKKMHIVSVPRDTMIEVDAYIDDGQYQRYWKINAAYTLGGEEELITHVQNLLDIKVNYMVEVDYQAFRNLVDAVGGVDMYIEQNMFYDDTVQNLHIKFNAGETAHLDGQKAEEFFRWRKNNDGTGLINGDIDRIKNQQKFIGKLVEKCLTPSIVFKIPKIFKAINDNVDTNLTANRMVSLGLKVLRLKPDDIIMTSLKGDFEEIYKQSYLVVDKSQNRELINALSTKEVTEDSVSSSKNRQEVKIMVLNGTKVNGLASNMQTELHHLGYTSVDVGNALSPSEKSIIQTNDKEIKELLKADTDISKTAKITDEEYKDYDAVIVLGNDYALFGE